MEFALVHTAGLSSLPGVQKSERILNASLACRTPSGNSKLRRRKFRYRGAAERPFAWRIAAVRSRENWSVMSIDELCDDIARMGIGKGDAVLVRAALKTMGLPLDRSADMLIDALLRVVGPNGTIIGLSFTDMQISKWARRKTHFTPQSPTNSGGFAAALLGRAQAFRSSHPTNSIVALGAEAVGLTTSHTKDRFAFSWMRRFIELDGKQLLVGCVRSSPGFSTVHFAQEELGLATRSLLSGLEGTFIDINDQEIWYARSDSPGCSRGFEKLYSDYVSNGFLATGHIAKAYCIQASARACIAVEMEKLKKNPRAALCDHPDCLSCSTRTYALSRIPAFFLAQGRKWVKRRF